MNMSDDVIKLHVRCLRCNRKLKDPESMRRGLGPVCTKKAEVELKENGKGKVPAGDADGPLKVDMSVEGA